MFWLFIGCVSVEKWFTPSNSCFSSQEQIDGALQGPASSSPCRNTPSVPSILRSVLFGAVVLSACCFKAAQCIHWLSCQNASPMLERCTPLSFLAPSLSRKKKEKMVTPALRAFPAPFVWARQLSRSWGVWRGWLVSFLCICAEQNTDWPWVLVVPQELEVKITTFLFYFRISLSLIAVRQVCLIDFCPELEESCLWWRSQLEWWYVVVVF